MPKKCCIGKIKVLGGFFFYFLNFLKNTNLNMPVHTRQSAEACVKCEGSC